MLRAIGSNAHRNPTGPIEPIGACCDIVSFGANWHLKIAALIDCNFSLARE
jgi:hypothetical protein